MHKYNDLEGLRGLAALIVVAWHFTIAFLPFLIGFAAVPRSTELDRFFTNTPLFLPFAGTFSVAVFFVLSGFVLSLSFFRRRDYSVLVTAAARRYFRLMFPVLASVMLAFVIMTISSGAHHATGQITGSPWLNYFWNFTPNLWEALRQGTFGAFFNGESSYNSNLWTMQVELIGSFIVFGILAFFGKLRRRWFIYVALAIIFSHSWYLAFLLGLIISDIWVNFPAIKEKITPRLATGLLMAGVVAGSWHYSHNLYGGFYQYLQLPFFGLTGTEQLIRTLGAACLIIAVLRLAWLSRFFKLRPLQYLGKISFSLYLVHFLVIYSFSCYIFNLLYPSIGYGPSFVVMLTLSIPVIGIMSHYFTKYVDAPTIGLSKRIGNWLTSSRDVNQKQAGEDLREPAPSTELAPGN